MRITCLTAIVVLFSAACSSDDPVDSCTPLGNVGVGAVGTIGAPLVDYADCYAGATPTVSLDGERAATATETELMFADSNVEATMDSACRLTITYTYNTMLSDNTPAVGTSVFAADPDLDAPGTWLFSPVGSNILAWDDGLDGAVCGNVIDDVYIVVEAR